ncbi:MAG: hypothetical protein RL660_2538 [Bacteroidota bacterium]|jgi:predicted CoA-binding protein
MSDNKDTLVIGASTNPDRYSYKAIVKLLGYGHSVQAVSVKKGEVQQVHFLDSMASVQSPVHTVTLYINPKLQEAYYNDIIALQPQRVIFNPGTENQDFYPLLRKNNIEVIEACTLVMLSVGTY